MEGIAGSDATLVEEFEHEGRTCRIAEFRDYWCGYIQLNDPNGVRRKYVSNFMDEHPVGGLTYGLDSNGWAGFDTAHPESKDWDISEVRNEVKKTAEQVAKYEKYAEWGTKESPAPDYEIGVQLSTLP